MSIVNGIFKKPQVQIVIELDDLNHVHVKTTTKNSITAYGMLMHAIQSIMSIQIMSEMKKGSDIAEDKKNSL